MEVSALKYSGPIGLHGRSPLLRVQTDDRLVGLVRRGNESAFEVLVGRYHQRLLAFCRHLLGSREDAEDVLQEALASAYNAMRADDRPINVRPWLYRIARNRCLNHLRRAQAIGVDSMDIHLAEHGASTADKVHDREEFRLLVCDIHGLPETQRTALVLREMDALSYEQIAEAMETTVSSVKSLLVRARVSLAEAAESRLLSCDEVRTELGEVAEGLIKKPSPLVRRHVKSCDRCQGFERQLKHTGRALAALLPIGPLAVLRTLAFTHLTHSAGSTAASASGAAGAGAAGAAGAGAAGAGAGAGGVAGAGAFAGVGAAAGGSGGFVTAGVGALATKAAAGLAAAALVGGAVASGSLDSRHHHNHAQLAAAVAPAPTQLLSAASQTPSRTGQTAPASHPARAAHGGKHAANRPTHPRPSGHTAVVTTRTTRSTTTTTQTTTPTTTTTTTSTAATEPGRVDTTTIPTVLPPQTTVTETGTATTPSSTSTSTSSTSTSTSASQSTETTTSQSTDTTTSQSTTDTGQTTTSSSETGQTTPSSTTETGHTASLTSDAGATPHRRGWRVARR